MSEIYKALYYAKRFDTKGVYGFQSTSIHDGFANEKRKLIVEPYKSDWNVVKIKGCTPR